MKLFSYWRSSAAYRVRIALKLKGLEYELHPLDMLAGDHKSEQYLALNPAGLIPTLQLSDGRCLTQSTAILLWLEADYPEPALLPDDSFEQARVMSWVQTVACEIHPLNNIGVMNFLKSELDVPAEAVSSTWYFHWLKRGFDTLEAELSGAPYCHGEQLTLADVYLVPQVYNARRFKFDFSRHPKIASICEACNKLPAFIDALPENQPDAG